MLLIKQCNGEVVELVYGTSLENWRRFVAYRGFESHPLRQHTVVAQMVEQRSLKSQVVGSNPTNSTIAAFLGWGRISGPAPLPINWACGEAE